MSLVKSGQTWTGLFVTKDSTGALSAATTGPVGTLYVNGVSNAASVTITGSNPYKWSVTLPSLTAGDTVSMYITATIATVATAAVVAEGIGDTKRLSDLNDSPYNGGAVASVTAAVNINSNADITTLVGRNNPLDAAGVRGAVGMASADLDSQLSGIPLAVWNILHTVSFVLNSMGEWIVSKLDINVGSRGTSNYAGADTPGTTTLLTRNNPLDAAGIRAAVGLALANLDAQLAGLTSLTQADVRTAIGMAAANLDAQLAALPTDTSINTALSGVHGAGAWGAGAPGPDAATIAAAVDATLTLNHGVGLWISGSGTGANTFIYTLTDTNTLLPIPQAEVWVSTDLAGNNVVATGVTDNFGRVTFYLDSGIYYVWRSKAGWTFTNPDTEVV